MTNNIMRIELAQKFFGQTEKLFFTTGDMKVSTFRYNCGVCAIRLRNIKGEIIVLPFQGMQIWDATFEGKRLTMKAMRERPVSTRSYLENFGAFFVHCGFTAMGVPGPEDSHVLHGEMHNAPFTDVYVLACRDERGAYICIGGCYRHTIAFSADVLEECFVKLYEKETLIGIELNVSNLKRSSMEYMYMAHPDFRPIDGGKLVYSALCTPNNVRVRHSIPAHMKASREYGDLLASFQRSPEQHHVIQPGFRYDPEVVFFIDRYLADEDGWAYSMMVHPDGYAYYVKHKPSEFEHVIRWICRTPDQDCLGIALPATAEPEGYMAEKKKGNVKVMGPGQQLHFGIEVGLLAPAEAHGMVQKIESMLATAR